ncbi:MAG: HAD family hydrolase [Armatimonadota bacterium]
MFDNNIKAVVFDIGATLITGPPVAPNKIISSMIDGLSAQETSSIIMTTPIPNANAVCKLVEKKVGCLTDSVTTQIHKLYNEQENAPVAIDGAVECVLTLKNKGFKIGLLSDIWTPYYNGVCKAIPNVIEIADAIVLSYETGKRKPEKENFYKILNTLKVKPEEVVMVGDTYTHDILPAIEIGMKTIWILARPDKEAESIIDILNKNKPAPDITLMNIKELQYCIL